MVSLWLCQQVLYILLANKQKSLLYMYLIDWLVVPVYILLYMNMYWYPVFISFLQVFIYSIDIANCT